MRHCNSMSQSPGFHLCNWVTSLLRFGSNEWMVMEPYYVLLLASPDPILTPSLFCQCDLADGSRGLREGQCPAQGDVAAEAPTEVSQLAPGRVLSLTPEPLPVFSRWISSDLSGNKSVTRSRDPQKTTPCPHTRGCPTDTRSIYLRPDAGPAGECRVRGLLGLQQRTNLGAEGFATAQAPRSL